MPSRTPLPSASQTATWTTSWPACATRSPAAGFQEASQWTTARVATTPAVRSAWTATATSTRESATRLRCVAGVSSLKIKITSAFFLSLFCDARQRRPRDTARARAGVPRNNWPGLQLLGPEIQLRCQPPVVGRPVVPRQLPVAVASPPPGASGTVGCAGRPSQPVVLKRPQKIRSICCSSSP